MDSQFTYVDTPASLQEAADSLADATVIGVDTEADSFFSYTEKVCLVQITGNERDFIIDPLGVKDLSPLGPIMEDRGVVKVFHGADYDVVSLKRDFGFRIHNLFDTMIASQAVGVERFSLADLVEGEFGVVLEKKYQRHDWSQRPLLPEHLDYARLDSHFLPELRERLWERVCEKGREAQVREEFILLEAREWTGRVQDPSDWLRIKGVNKLRPDQQKVARALHRLRDGVARELDRPSFKVMGAETLLLLAREKPASRDALRRLLGERHFLFRRHGSDVLAAIADGVTSEEPLTPARKPSGGEGRRAFSREDERLFESLKGWRNQASSDRAVGPAMVVANGVLRSVAVLRPTNKEQLRGVPDIRSWQVEEFGAEILGLVQADGERNKAPKG